MSGSGKSTAIRALEDAGFFCIDNLPVLLLPKLTELAGLGNPGRRLARVMAGGEGFFWAEAPRLLDDLRRGGHQGEVLFPDSSNAAPPRRFSETRRRHPLAPHETISEGIERERSAL